MDDDLEDRIFYQTYVSHVKLLSRLAVGLPTASATMATVGRVCRAYLLRPDVFFLSIGLIVFLYYLQAVELWSRGMLDRITSSFGGSVAGTRRLTRSQLLAQMSLERHSWQLQHAESACYAVQGRRATMEDRYVIDENVNKTGVALFAIFDGHGGDFAANFAKSRLIDNISAKIVDTMSALRGIRGADDDGGDGRQYGRYTNKAKPNENGAGDAAAADGATSTSATTPLTPSKGADSAKGSSSATQQRRASLKKSFSTADDCGMNPSNCNREQDVFLDKLNAIIGGKGGGGAAFMAAGDASAATAKAQTYDGRTYIENGGVVNFGKLMVDEVLAADEVLIEQLQKKALLAGTTALMAIIHGSRLVVANVGDSRGVMCDWRGNAIPLSFDHKPQQVRERKRIQDAGGFISFKGVWRVAGILATSRALGDYPLKQNKKLVIAQPDILSFDLLDHKPKFLILASDGLWDTFSNEEAVAFIRKHLHEPLFGAKSLTHQAYQRGSVDNISVLVIAFQNDKYYIGANDGGGGR